MTTPGMEESNQPLIQLFRTVEEAMSIAGSNARAELGLRLDTAELELTLGTTKEGGAGIEIKSLGIDASGKKTSESSHQYKLKLKPAAKPYDLPGPSSGEVAETILALGKAASSVAQRGGGFTIDEAALTVDLTQSTEGGFKIGVGGRGGSETVGRITLTFKKRVD